MSCRAVRTPGWRRALGRRAPTDEDEAHGDEVGEHVAADGLAVPPVALPEEADERVELVPAEALRGEGLWGRHEDEGSSAAARARTKPALPLR